MADQQSSLSVFTLPAGTVCHRNGVPFTLLHATQIECHPGVWPLIKGEPPEPQEIANVSPTLPLAPASAAELPPFLERLMECGGAMHVSEFRQ